MSELPPLDTIVIDYVGHLEMSQDQGSLAALSNFYNGHEHPSLVKLITQNVCDFAESYLPKKSHHDLEEFSDFVKFQKRAIISWGFGITGAIMAAGGTGLAYLDYFNIVETAPFGGVLFFSGLISLVVGVKLATSYERRGDEAADEFHRVMNEDRAIYIDQNELCDELHAKKFYVMNTLGLLDLRVDAALHKNSL